MIVGLVIFMIPLLILVNQKVPPEIISAIKDIMMLMLFMPIKIPPNLSIPKNHTRKPIFIQKTESKVAP
jgi:hypothetical protein